MPQTSLKNSEPSSLFCFLALLFSLLMMVGGCESSTPRPLTMIKGETMGTYYRVTLGELSSDEAVKLKIDIEQILIQVNQSMSTYLPQSELSRFNSSKVDEVMQISDGLAFVLDQALYLYTVTEGAFDITVGPLVRLWGFGPDGRIDRQPQPQAVREGLSKVGVHNIQLQANQLSKLGPVEIDLSAIAKGYAIDQIADYLNAAAMPNWLIDVGGELRARGKNQNRSWQVAIEKPDLGGGIQQAVPLHNQAIATSGDYRNFVVLNGETYSHGIDPKTGYPVKHRLASVSVLHESASVADAWATALLIMGEKAAQSAALEHGLSVYMIVRTDAPAEFKIIGTGEFTRLTH